jgi:hypothetical protein
MVSAAAVVLWAATAFAQAKPDFPVSGLQRRPRPAAVVVRPAAVAALVAPAVVVADVAAVAAGSSAG